MLVIIAIVKLYYSETARMEKMKEKYPAPITMTTKPSTETTETTEKIESSSLIKIGRWIDQDMSIVMSLYQKGDKVYLEKASEDGSKGTTEMKVQIDKGQKRYVDVDGSDFGEYYLVDDSGNLGVYDNQGLIFTAIKINKASNNKADNPPNWRKSS